MKKRRLAKIQNRALLASLLAVHGTAIASTVAPGTLINVDFNGGNGTRGRAPDPVTFDGVFTNALTDASVAMEDSDPAVPDQWNGIGFTDAQSQPLFDSTGAATNVSTTWSGFTFTYHNYSNTDSVNFTNGPNADGFYAHAGAPATVTIDGLDPAKTYNVVPLGAGDGTDFTIGDATLNVPAWGIDNASNWSIYYNIAPSPTGSITITASIASGNFGMGGFQIAVSGTIPDKDRDGIPDIYEDAHGLNKNDASDAAKDPDKDGLSTLEEYLKGTDPQRADTDGDGLRDDVETATGTWQDATHTGTDPLKADTDGDGLSDGDEKYNLATGTDPNRADTDADGFSDSAEIAAGTNPRDSVSNPRLKATGQLINVDFNGGNGTRGRTPDPVTFDGVFTNALTVASVAVEDSDPAVPDQWNGIEFTDAQSQPLFDSTGAATNVSTTWGGFTFTYHNASNTDPVNFTNGPNADGFFGRAGAPATVTINGLDATKTYNVVPFGSGDGTDFTIGNDTRSVPAWRDGDGSNWSLYNNIVPSPTGSITITASTTSGNFGMGGFQIAVSGTIPDRDHDGIPDTYEDAHGLNKNDASDAAKDPDKDGLSNLEEYLKGTDLQKADTDGDGLRDNVETATGTWQDATHTGTDPLKADTDGDGLSDGDEKYNLATGTDPNRADTDADGFLDSAEIAAGTNPRDYASNPRLKATGQLINVDFNARNGTRGRTPDPITFDGVLTNALTGASVAVEDSDPAVPDQWNGIEFADAQSQPLFDSTGAATNVSTTWSGFTFTYHNYSNTDSVNFTNGPNADGFYAHAGAPATVTIDGLDPAKTYNVVPLGAGDGTDFTIGDATLNVPAWGIDNASNWSLYNNIAPSPSGSITITAASTGGNFGMGGFQIAVSGALTQLSKFNLLSFSRSASTGNITLSWESIATSTYTIQWSTGLSGFQAVTGQTALPGVAGSMTRTFSSPVPGAPRLFFRVVAN